MNTQGESSTGVLNLASTGELQVVDVQTVTRGDATFARNLQLYNFGPDPIEVAFGNGELSAFVPVAISQPFGTDGPITKFALRAAPASVGARVSYSLRNAGGK